MDKVVYGNVLFRVHNSIIYLLIFHFQRFFEANGYLSLGAYLVRSLADSVGDLGVQTELFVDDGGRLFECSERLDDWQGHPFSPPVTDREVHHGSGRLSTVVLLVRHLKVTCKISILLTLSAKTGF